MFPKTQYYMSLLFFNTLVFSTLSNYYKELAMTLGDEKTLLPSIKSSQPDIPVIQLPIDQKRYKMHESLGKGGSGQVFKAYDTKLLRDVAIKIIPVEHHDVLNEAQALARLNHPNIVKIHDVAHNDKFVAIVMEYVEANKILSSTSIAAMCAEEFYDFYYQVLNAVSAIHEQGLLHLDLKPGNILLDQHNQVKVTDFGISICTSKDAIALSSSKGSWYCLSPEQIENHNASKASDVFAMGILWHVFLYKEHPFLVSGNATASKRNLINGNIQGPKNPHLKIAGQDEQLVLRMLSKDPHHRPSLTTIIQYIETKLSHRSDEDQLITQTFDLPAANPRRIWLWPTVAAFIIAVSTIFLVIHPLSSPIKATLVVPTRKINHPDNPNDIKHLDNNLLVATIIEDELEAAVIRDPQRRLVSKKEWRGSRNWQQEAVQVDVEDIISSEVSCGEAFCDIRLTIYNRDLNRQTHFVSKRIPHVDLIVLSQAVELSLSSKLGLATKKKVRSDITDQDLRLYLEYKTKLDRIDNREEDLIILEKFVKTKPDFIGAHLLLGESYSALYNKTKNTRWLDKLGIFIMELKQLFPNHPAILELDFDLYIHRNNLAAATATLNRLKQQAGVDVNRLTLSEAYVQFKQNPLRGYQTLLSIEQPRLTHPYFHNKALMEDRLNYFEALEQTTLRWRDHFPNSAMPLFYLAKSYLSQGKLQLALDLNKNIYTKNPDYPSLFNIALCQLLLGKYKQSSENFEKILMISPSAEALLNLAESLKAAKDERANEYFLRALDGFRKIEQPSSLDLAYQALTLAHLGKSEQAVIALQQAARSAQRDDSFFLIAAYVYSVLKQPNAALFNAQEAAKFGFRAHWFNLPWTASLYNKINK